MDDVLSAINNVKEALLNVIKENNIECEYSPEEILLYYSADFTDILLYFYPSATIMIDKFYKTSAILINGNIYNSYGLVDSYDYHIASKEELNYIRTYFPKISDDVINKLNLKLNIKNNTSGNSYTLRKNKS